MKLNIYQKDDETPFESEGAAPKVGDVVNFRGEQRYVLGLIRDKDGVRVFVKSTEYEAPKPSKEGSK